MKASIISIIVLCFLSCTINDKTTLIYDSFKHEINIEGKNIGPKDTFLKPYQLTITDSVLIVLDNSTKKHIYILNANNYKIISSYGKSGNGPNEFIFPEISKRAENNRILVTNKGKFYSAWFSIDSMIYSNNYFPSQKIIYPHSLIIPFNILAINDTCFIGSTSSGNTRIFKYNTKSEKVKFEKNNISFDGIKKTHISDLGQIYYSISDFNHEKRKIVNVMRFFDRIDIIDTDLEIERSIICNHTANKNYKFKNEGEIFNDNTVFYYIDVFTTNKYIYALYCGLDFKNAIPNVGNEIHVFNWEGAAVYNMKLNIGLSNIVVSKNNSELYGFDIYSNQPIVYFNLMID